MDTLTALYSTQLTIIIIITLLVACLKASVVWVKVARKQEDSLHKREMFGLVAILIPAAFLFLSLDVAMYSFGADISPERLKSSFRAFFIATTISIYFGLIVPRVFRIDLVKLWNATFFSWPLFWGMLSFMFGALVTAFSRDLSEFIFDTYAPCVLNF